MFFLTPPLTLLGFKSTIFCTLATLPNHLTATAPISDAAIEYMYVSNISLESSSFDLSFEDRNYFYDFVLEGKAVDEDVFNPGEIRNT